MADSDDAGASLLGLACALSATALGHALQRGNGNLAEGALSWLSLAGALLIAGLVLSERAPEAVDRAARRLMPVALGVCVVWVGEQWMTRTPTYQAAWNEGWVLPVVAALGVVASSLGRRPLLGRATGPVLVLLYVAAGVWLLGHTPPPRIDVYVFQKDGVEALLRGDNPYALTFPDIYGKSSSFFYGPGVSVDGRLQFGFLYPPLSLLLAVPGHLLGADFRYSQLFANAGAGLLMWGCVPGRRGWGSAAAFLYLFTPRSLYLLEQGWTEPFVVLALAAVVYAALRVPRLLPWLFGLFACVKQYVALLLPLAWLLRRARNGHFALRAATAAAGVTLPLALISPRCFWTSVVALQWKQPFRPDSLSYWAWRVNEGLSPLSTHWAFIAVAVALAIALMWAPRTTGGFAASIGLVLLGFFAFNKQAFCNYYSAALGALCVALATSKVRFETGPTKKSRLREANRSSV